MKFASNGSVGRMLLGIFLLTVLSSRARPQSIRVTTAQYPTYTNEVHEEPVPNKWPHVPYIFDSEWPLGASHDFFVLDQTQIRDKSRWRHHDHDRGFTIGCNSHYVLRDGRYRREWYLWFRWYGRAALQPMRYSYTNATNNPYGPLLPGGNPSPDQFFSPAKDCSYESFWEDERNLRVLRGRIVIGTPTLPTEPRCSIWRQYTKICPKTFTDTLRWQFGWEGPRVRPEPTPLHDDLIPTIDLREGMRLRVDFSGYFNQGPPREGNEGDHDRLHRGFVGTGSSFYTVCRLPRKYLDSGEGSFGVVSGKLPVLTLQPFLGHVRQSMNSPWLKIGDSAENLPPNVVTTPSDTLLAPYTLSRYLRLAYPDGKTFVDRRHVGVRNDASSDLYLYPKNHPVLVFGDDRSQLRAQDIGASLLGRDFELHDDIEPKFVAVRGRAILQPEISIRINGVDRFVPVGTRLRQLVSTQLTGSPASLTRRITVRRQQDDQLVPIRFDVDQEGMVLELPLLKGDVVSW